VIENEGHIEMLVEQVYSAKSPNGPLCRESLPYPNWLTREQAKELLAVPDRSTLKGKRDYVILALLVGCALRRNELAELDVETIQQREGRWVLADLEGKGRRIRTVAIPIWVKHGINAWMIAAGIEDGRLLRSVSKNGKVNRDTLSDWAVWSVVE
jgi:integrase